MNYDDNNDEHIYEYNGIKTKSKQEREYTIVNVLIDQIHNFVRNDDLNTIKAILFKDIYTQFSKEEKEENIYRSASYFYKYEGRAEKIIKYLVFDYNIKEREHVIHNEPVERLFAIRKANEELNANLPQNTTQSKRLKI